MKRCLLVLFVGLSVLVLGGCPIYPDNASHRVCTSTGCWECRDNYYSYDCTPWICERPSDCPAYYECTPAGLCEPIQDAGSSNEEPYCTSPTDCPSGKNCGYDNRCHVGNCADSGCPSGYICKLSNGAPQCVLNGSPDAGPHGLCDRDSECMAFPAGSKCIGGRCVKPEDQCFDGTQCANDSACVDGICTPRCDETHPCPIGFACDPRGVCSGNDLPCAANPACPTGTVCVEEHCVTPCDTLNPCANGLVCVNGGCIPDQGVKRRCDTEGEVGDGTAGKCALGNVCLHHACYAECDADGGAPACSGRYDQCKAVTRASTYHVCGSSTNLGGECDPTKKLGCDPGLLCIDGYCR